MSIFHDISLWHALGNEKLQTSKYYFIKKQPSILCFIVAIKRVRNFFISFYLYLSIEGSSHNDLSRVVSPIE
jgi:hypothetical protein